MTKTRLTHLAGALLTILSAFATRSASAKNSCRSSDKVESGLQGQTTQAEIDSGAVAKGFNCNTDIVGQYQGEGASWQLTAWKNCAYFDQRLNSAEAHPGTVVLDVSDPKNPKATAWLGGTPPDNAMLDPWESLKVNQARQLLGAAQRPGTQFSIYDISQDCTHPVQMSSINIPGMFGHTGQWAPDGNTYYVTPLRADQSIIAIDTKDATHPALIPCGAGTYGCGSNGFFVAPSDIPLPSWHDLEFSKDGNTAYITMFGSPFGNNAASNGLLILDVSDFQSRKANPAYRKIGSLTWDDGSVGAQNALAITISGKPYVLFSDEGGPGAAACSQGKSGAGFPRLIDISNPASPTVAAKIMLEIHQPANCATAQAAPISPSGNFFGSFFNHSCHYCNVDDPDNARLAACNCFAAGMRVWDISNVSNIHEVGYLKPPAQGTKALPGSQYANSVPTTFVRNYDMATSKPNFPKNRGASSGDIWTTYHDNGFVVVHLQQSSGGCASADASIGGLLLFGLAQMLRRRQSRSGC